MIGPFNLSPGEQVWTMSGWYGDRVPVLASVIRVADDLESVQVRYDDERTGWRDDFQVKFNGHSR